MRYILAILACAPLAAQVVSSSFVPRYQVTGERQQLDLVAAGFSYGHQATTAQTMTNSGVFGADEGANAIINGKLWAYFGDSPPVYYDTGLSKFLSIHWKSVCNFGSGTVLCLGAHPIGFYQSGATFGGCHSYENQDATLRSQSTQASTCPAFTLVTDPSHTGNTPKVAYQYINNSVAGESYAAGNPPTGLFQIGNTVYALEHVVGQSWTRLGAKTKAALFKATVPAASWGATTPVTWDRISTVSQAPTIPGFTGTVTTGSATITRTSGDASTTDWANSALYETAVIRGNRQTGGIAYRITAVSGNTITISPTYAQSDCNSGCSGSEIKVIPVHDSSLGKFVEVSCEVLTDANVPLAIKQNAGWPSALAGKDVAFCFGANFQYRASNLYMAVAEASEAVFNSLTYSSGVQQWYYLTGVTSGVPTFTLGDEIHAVPLIASWQHSGVSGGLKSLGENSVRWHPLMGRWILTSASAEHGGGWVRATLNPLPWLWGNEVQVISNQNKITVPSSWHAKLVYNPADSGYTDFNNGPGSPGSDATFPYVWDADSPSSLATNSPWGNFGNIYGFYQLPAAFDEISGNTVTFFFHASLFDPYEVIMASAQFTAPPAARSNAHIIASVK